MVLYVVTNDGSYSSMFIVKAKNKKEAIDKVFKQCFEWQNQSAREEGYKPFARSDFEARKLDEMFDEDIVELN